MTTEFLTVVFVVGIGTWLFRFLPTRVRRRPEASGQTPDHGHGTERARRRQRRLGEALTSIGPAAIATLFIASVLPAFTTGARESTLVLVGCAATILVFALRRNVVLATIAGAAAYGLAYGLLGG